MGENYLKVSSKTDTKNLAGCIAKSINEKGYCEVHAIGAGAVNQAVKAIAIARGMVATYGKNLICIPAFKSVIVDSAEVSAILFKVKEEK